MAKVKDYGRLAAKNSLFGKKATQKPNEETVSNVTEKPKKDDVNDITQKLNEETVSNVNEKTKKDDVTEKPKNKRDGANDIDFKELFSQKESIVTEKSTLLRNMSKETDHVIGFISGVLDRGKQELIDAIIIDFYLKNKSKLLLIEKKKKKKLLNF